MIVLIRHATPIIDNSKCGNKQAKQRLHEYNHTKKINLNEIECFRKNAPPILLKTLSQKNLSVYVSNYPRALETAKKLFPNDMQSFNVSSDYREFVLDIINIPFIKLSTHAWFLTSRIAWFFNIFKTPYPVKQECNRAKFAAKQLIIQDQTTENDIVLVAHGLMNKVVSHKLKSATYTLKNKYCKGCFTVELFDCIKP